MWRRRTTRVDGDADAARSRVTACGSCQLTRRERERPSKPRMGWGDALAVLLLGGTGEGGPSMPSVVKPSSPIGAAHRYSGTRGIGRRTHSPALAILDQLLLAQGGVIEPSDAQRTPTATATWGADERGRQGRDDLLSPMRSPPYPSLRAGYRPVYAPSRSVHEDSAASVLPVKPLLRESWPHTKASPIGPLVSNPRAR